MSTSLNRGTFATGEVIFRPGDPAGQYYYVVEGQPQAAGAARAGAAEGAGEG